MMNISITDSLKIVKDLNMLIECNVAEYDGRLFHQS